MNSYVLCKLETSSTMEYHAAAKKDEDIISGMICADLQDILIEKK